MIPELHALVSADNMWATNDFMLVRTAVVERIETPPKGSLIANEHIIQRTLEQMANIKVWENCLPEGMCKSADGRHKGVFYENRAEGRKAWHALELEMAKIVRSQNWMIFCGHLNYVPIFKLTLGDELVGYCSSLSLVGSGEYKFAQDTKWRRGNIENILDLLRTAGVHTHTTAYRSSYVENESARNRVFGR